MERSGQNSYPPSYLAFASWERQGRDKQKESVRRDPCLHFSLSEREACLMA